MSAFGNRSAVTLLWGNAKLSNPLEHSLEGDATFGVHPEQSLKEYAHLGGPLGQARVGDPSTGVHPDPYLNEPETFGVPLERTLVRALHGKLNESASELDLKELSMTISSLVDSGVVPGRELLEAAAAKILQYQQQLQNEHARSQRAAEMSQCASGIGQYASEMSHPQQQEEEHAHSQRAAQTSRGACEMIQNASEMSHPQQLEESHSHSQRTGQISLGAERAHTLIPEYKDHHMTNVQAVDATAGGGTAPAVHNRATEGNEKVTTQQICVFLQALAKMDRPAPDGMVGSLLGEVLQRVREFTPAEV